MKSKLQVSNAGILTLSLIFFSALSHSALINRGGGLIYDDVLDITWMQDANFMQTSGADADGFAIYNQASSYVNNLSFGGYSDWRLPTITPGNGINYDIAFSYDGSTDRGFNNDGVNNELGYMFTHNLNNTSFFSALGVGSQSSAGDFNSTFIDGESGQLYQFENIGLSYWADPANNPIQNAAWGFNFRITNDTPTGESQLLSLNAGLSVWAVRDGDVQSTINNTPGGGTIPEPDTIVMFALGLLGLFSARRHSIV